MPVGRSFLFTSVAFIFKSNNSVLLSWDTKNGKGPAPRSVSPPWWYVRLTAPGHVFSPDFSGSSASWLGSKSRVVPCLPAFGWKLVIKSGAAPRVNRRRAKLGLEGTAQETAGAHAARGSRDHAARGVTCSRCTHADHVPPSYHSVNITPTSTIDMFYRGGWMAILCWFSNK